MGTPEEKIVKEPVNVLIYLESCKIKGTIYLPIGSRLTDFINDPNVRFLPVTDAVVESVNIKDKWSYKVEFMNLNKDFIVSIQPIGE